MIGTSSSRSRRLLSAARMKLPSHLCRVLHLFDQLTIHSELHVYRGHESAPGNVVMGHEFTGVVVEAGPAVRTVKVGDKIVSPFTVSW